MSPESVVVIIIREVLGFFWTIPRRLRNWRRDRVDRQLATEEARRRWEGRQH